MFQASSCPSSGAYQLQEQQPLVYRRNVVVAVLLVVLRPIRIGWYGWYGKIKLNLKKQNVRFWLLGVSKYGVLKIL
jgi:hypothetical protein